MGLFSQGRKNARFLQGNSMFTPFGINTAGGTVSFNTPTISNKDWKKIRGGKMPMPDFSATMQLSPEMQALREQMVSGAGQFLGSAMGTGVPGFAGITPEMFAEFTGANSAIDALGVPGATIDPEALAGMISDAPANQFLNLSQQFGNELSGMDFDQVQAARLDLARRMAADRESKLRMGNVDEQFSYGNLASTAGQYQTRGLEEALGTIDLGRQANAFNEALGLRSQLADLTSGFGMAGNQMQSSKAGFLGSLKDLLFQQLMSGNVLQGSRAQDRFNRAYGMFGLGKQAQAGDLGMAGGYLSGIAGLDSNLAALAALGSNLGSARSSANVAANTPMVQAGMASDAFGQGMLSSALSGLMGGISYNPGAAAGSRWGFNVPTKGG